MKVSIYKHEDGKMSALVQASVGKGLPPVVIQGITPENVEEKIAATVAELRKPRAPRLP